MIRHLIFLVMIVCAVRSGIAQNVYYDAKQMHDNDWVILSTKTKKGEVIVTPGNVDQTLPLLFKYLSDQDKKLVEDESDLVKKLELYKTAFKENPFITIAGTVQDDALTNVVINARSQVEKTMGPSSGQGITSKIVDGIAKFLVKRTKEELTTTFFETFNAELEKQADLKKLFPSTYGILSTATAEIFNYQAYLPSLREAFEYDLENFFSNAFEWTKSNEGVLIKELVLKKELYAGFKTSFFVGRELDRGSHPGEVINSVVMLNRLSAKQENDSLDLSALNPNFFPVMKTVNLFSQALRSDSTTGYWITEEEFRSFRVPVFSRMFFGLIYQQVVIDVSPVTFTVDADTILLSDILKGGADRVNDLQGLIQSFHTKFSGIQKQIEVIRNSSERRVVEYARLAKDVFGIVNVASNNSLLSSAGVIAVPSSVSFYVEHFAGLWSHIESKSYNSAVFEAYILLDKAIANNSKKATLKAFLKYGTFMASVATAENSDQVALAIEAIVLPPGSASIKRKSKSNVSLNAYVGLSPGYEWKQGSFDNGRFTFAVSAPIGLAISRGKYIADGEKFKERGSSSWFISLVDLGAVTAYRFNDENTAVLPELKFSNIFAPGLYYVRGIPKSPISIGLGSQLGPQLRKVENATASINNTLNYSLKLFVAVDIPLLNFYTKTR